MVTSPDRPSPVHVSTGDLPSAETVVELVADAHRRFATVSEGAVADYIPILAEASADWFGICIVGAAGTDRRRRRHRPDVLDPEHLEAVRVRVGVRRGRTRSRARRPRCEQHRAPVRLRDGDRAQRWSTDESDGQRGRDRDHEPRARRRRGRAVGIRARGAVTIRRAGSRARRGGVPVRGVDQPPQPWHRASARWIRPSLCRSRRDHRRLHQAVLAPRLRPRPRRHGSDPRRRWGEPADRRARGGRGDLSASPGGPRHLRALRAQRRLALRLRTPGQERRERRRRHRRARQGRPGCLLPSPRRGRQQRARPTRRRATSPKPSGSTSSSPRHSDS